MVRFDHKHDATPGNGRKILQSDLDNTTVTAPLTVVSMTTTERDALTPADGMIIHNSTVDEIQTYTQAQWVTLVYIGGPIQLETLTTAARDSKYTSPTVSQFIFNGDFLAPQVYNAAWKTVAYRKLKVVSKTANYTATLQDDVIECDTSGGVFTITLPTITGNLGVHYWIVKTNIERLALTITGTGGNTVQGESSIAIVQRNTSLHLVAISTGYIII